MEFIALYGGRGSSKEGDGASAVHRAYGARSA